MTKSATTDAITANLNSLRERLQPAALRAVQASAAKAGGDQNLAIGTILDLDRLLPECDALYRTVLLLHSSREGEGCP